MTKKNIDKKNPCSFKSWKNIPILQEKWSNQNQNYLVSTRCFKFVKYWQVIKSRYCRGNSIRDINDDKNNAICIDFSRQAKLIQIEKKARVALISFWKHFDQIVWKTKYQSDCRHEAGHQTERHRNNWNSTIGQEIFLKSQIIIKTNVLKFLHGII